jgi:hypothetical protein
MFLLFVFAVFVGVSLNCNQVDGEELLCPDKSRPREILLNFNRLDDIVSISHKKAGDRFGLDDKTQRPFWNAIRRENYERITVSLIRSSGV